MDEDWDRFESALASSDPDQVNDLIDDIGDVPIDERVDLFETRSEALTALYANSDDGYVRQSVVRVVGELAPGLPAAVSARSETVDAAASETTLQENTDMLCGFLLEAMTDDDGRVRQSAKRTLEGVFRTYDELGEDETVEALADELETMAEDYTDKRREHLLEASNDAEHALQSVVGTLIRNAHEQFGGSLDDA